MRIKRDEMFYENIKKDLACMTNAELKKKYRTSREKLISLREIYNIPYNDMIREKIRQKRIEALKIAQTADEMTKEEWKKRMVKARREVNVRERRRIVMGLEQKTKLKLSLNRKHSQWVALARNRFVRRNNYFFFKEDDRTLYYDNDTIRSEYIEEQYGKVFRFIASEDYDPSRKNFVKQKRKVRLSDGS